MTQDTHPLGACAEMLPAPPVECPLEFTRAVHGKILHVDDDVMAGQALAAWFKCQGYEVKLAMAPEEADACLRREAFDLILTDIHMPGNERLEWVEQLLAQADAPPILLLTGNPQLETACRAANLPIAGYFVKPPDFARLAATVRRVIDTHRERDEFLVVAHEMLALLATHGANGLADESALVERLARLAGQFAARHAREEHAGAEPAASDETWRHAIEETIDVIAKTKHSFRSKELGRLRLRLQQMLDHAHRGATPRTEKRIQVAAGGVDKSAALRCAQCATA